MSNNKINDEILNNNKLNNKIETAGTNVDDLNYENNSVFYKLQKKLLKLEEKLIEKKKFFLNNEKKYLYKNKKILEKANKFSLEKIIFEILPIIDNLERAYALLKKEDNVKKISIKTLLKSALKTIIFVIKKYGVDIINTTNLEFNPNIHQAISIQKSDFFKDNYIMSIIQNGYMLNGRLLRPAMVIVAKK